MESSVAPLPRRRVHWRYWLCERQLKTRGRPLERTGLHDVSGLRMSCTGPVCRLDADAGAAHIAPGRSCVSLTASAIVSQVSRRSSAAVSLAVA